MITRAELEELHALSQQVYVDGVASPDRARHNELVGKYNALMRAANQIRGNVVSDIKDETPSYLIDTDPDTEWGAVWLLKGIASSVITTDADSTIYYIPECRVKVSYDEKLECTIFFIEDV